MATDLVARKFVGCCRGGVSVCSLSAICRCRSLCGTSFLRLVRCCIDVWSCLTSKWLPGVGVVPQAQSDTGCCPEERVLPNTLPVVHVTLPSAHRRLHSHHVVYPWGYTVHGQRWRQVRLVVRANDIVMYGQREPYSPHWQSLLRWYH